MEQDAESRVSLLDTSVESTKSISDLQTSVTPNSRPFANMVASGNQGMNCCPISLVEREVVRNYVRCFAQKIYYFIFVFTWKDRSSGLDYIKPIWASPRPQKARSTILERRSCRTGIS